MMYKAPKKKVVSVKAMFSHLFTLDLVMQALVWLHMSSEEQSALVQSGSALLVQI